MSAHWTIDRRMLRWHAKEHGWTTNEQIAEALHVSTTTLWRATNGHSEPGEHLLAAIRLAFGASAFAEITSVVREEMSS